MKNIMVWNNKKYEIYIKSFSIEAPKNEIRFIKDQMKNCE